jgi:hypothetical protein
MCSSSGRTLFICSEKDCIGDCELTPEEQLNIRKCIAVKKMKCLPDEIEIAISMKVLVMYNVETNLDITNGAQGTISNIIFDAREKIDQYMSLHCLQYLPKYILVRMERTKACKLSSLEDNVILIEPMTTCIDIPVQENERD